MANPNSNGKTNLATNPFRKTNLMFGSPYNLFLQHALYRALPHREGAGVPRDIATDSYDRAAVRPQLRKELKCIRNVDMFSLLATHVIRLHSRKPRGATSMPAFVIARARPRPSF